jgi:SAM-dependent methyltransferase
MGARIIGGSTVTGPKWSMTRRFYPAIIPLVAWYKEWFGKEYLDLYSHRNRGEAELHIDFVDRIFSGSEPRAVLDLACGAGRHTAVLRERGYRALGFDLSLTLLTQNALPFADGTFDWILNFFTSFGYFESERENFRVLEEVARSLAPRGRFLIDLFNRDYVVSHLQPRESQDRNGYQVEIERWFDHRTERVNFCRERAGLQPRRGGDGTGLDRARGRRSLWQFSGRGISS